MRLLRVLAPGADEAFATRIRDAVVEFNGTLDIRLRFLAIGIDERELCVEDAESAAEEVSRAVEEFAPDAVVLLGEGEAAVAAASVVVRARRVLLRAGAGRRDGPHPDAARAIDRVASMLLTYDDAAERAVAEEGLAGVVIHVGSPEDPGSGERVIHALRQARQRRLGGGT